MNSTTTSPAGEAHLTSLRAYIARMTEVAIELGSYAVLTIPEFGREQQALCTKAVEDAVDILLLLAAETDISEGVYDGMSDEQRRQLAMEMDRLESYNSKVVVLVAKMGTAVVFLRALWDVEEAFGGFVQG